MAPQGWNRLTASVTGFLTLVELTLTAHGSVVLNRSPSGSLYHSRLGSWASLLRRHRLKPPSIHSGNSMIKFANGSYLVIPASNHGSCAEDIQYIRDWASSNNLCLTLVNSIEIVFMSPRC
jgi:hypothetical protein